MLFRRKAFKARISIALLDFYYIWNERVPRQKNFYCTTSLSGPQLRGVILKFSELFILLYLVYFIPYHAGMSSSCSP